MDDIYRLAIIVICFFISRAWTLLVEGILKCDLKGWIVKFIVVLLTFAAIGISHYAVFWGVNRMAWSEVRHWGVVFLAIAAIEVFVWDILSMIIHYKWAKSVNE